MQNDCAGRAGRQPRIHRKHLFGSTRPFLPSNMLASLSYWQRLFLNFWTSSNEANDHRSARMKQLKVKRVGRLTASDYPCDGNLTNRKSE